MKYIFFLLAGIFFLASTTQAQDYSNALGIRAGGKSGITYKHINTSNAFEGIVGIWGGGFGVTLLYEKYARAFNEPGFSWYYGGGGHIAFYDNYNRGRWYSHDGNADMGFGIDGIVGLEYKIPPIPIAISLDLIPFLEINTDGGVKGWIDPGFGVKFAF